MNDPNDDDEEDDHVIENLDDEEPERDEYDYPTYTFNPYYEGE